MGIFGKVKAQRAGKARNAEAKWRRDQAVLNAKNREAEETETSHPRYAGAELITRLYGREVRNRVTFITPAMVATNPHLKRIVQKRF